MRNCVNSVFEGGTSHAEEVAYTGLAFPGTQRALKGIGTATSGLYSLPEIMPVPALLLSIRPRRIATIWNNVFRGTAHCFVLG